MADTEGSLTLDNASVQRLMDYGLLHFTNKGWIVGKWEDAERADALTRTPPIDVEAVARQVNGHDVQMLGDVLDIIHAAEHSFAQTDDHRAYYDARFKAVERIIAAMRANEEKS